MDTDEPDADDLRGDPDFPWEDIEASRQDDDLQRRHAGEVFEREDDLAPIACPLCGKRGENLARFYFQSPAWTWRELCGRAGIIVVCDPCRKQVAFAPTVIN